MKKSDVTWTQVDTKTLSKTSAALYAKMQETSKAAAEASAAFQKSFIPELITLGAVEKDANVKVSNRFGKLAFAVVDDAPRGGGTPLFSMKK